MDGDPIDDPNDDIEEWDEVEDTLKLVDREQTRGGTTFLGEVEGVTEPEILFRV